MKTSDYDIIEMPNDPEKRAKFEREEKKRGSNVMSSHVSKQAYIDDWKTFFTRFQKEYQVRNRKTGTETMTTKYTYTEQLKSLKARMPYIHRDEVGSTVFVLDYDDISDCVTLHKDPEHQNRK